MRNLRNIPDFPCPGIQFKDVASLFCKHECLEEIATETARLYKDKGITKVVGIESRGFVVGALVAERLGAGFVMCRKKGKLPGAVVSKTFQKEYGTDIIEMQEGAISETDVVLLHDDLLATGGSMRAAYDLVQQFHPRKTYVNFIIELLGEGLHGRDAFTPGTDITALLPIDN